MPDSYILACVLFDNSNLFPPFVYILEHFRASKHKLDLTLISVSLFDAVFFFLVDHEHTYKDMT